MHSNIQVTKNYLKQGYLYNCFGWHKAAFTPARNRIILQSKERVANVNVPASSITSGVGSNVVSSWEALSDIQLVDLNISLGSCVCTIMKSNSERYYCNSSEQVE